ncbi:hypothetical protein AC1031_019532 [Aphanomyces cochlioides]|nr:hypothetical protein AC1031_019532 [Aphanomyces cochlioides]
MVALPKSSSALILIDVQEGFHQPPYSSLARSTPEFEANVTALLAAFRQTELPVIHVHHHSLLDDSPFHPTRNPTGIEPLLFARPAPGEPVVMKNVNSSFIGTNLESLLRDNKWDTLVVVGLTTSHCVSTTVRMAGNLGFRVFLPRDGTAMFERPTAPGSKLGIDKIDAEIVHEISLAELHDEFATVVDTQDILNTLSSSSA